MSNFPPYSRLEFIDLIEDVCKGDEILEEFVFEWEVVLLKHESAEEFFVNMKMRGNLDPGYLEFYGFKDDEAFVSWIETFYEWIKVHGVPE